MNSAASFVDPINAEYREVVKAEKSALPHAIKCGELLNLAKENVKAEKMKWGEWLKVNCPRHRARDRKPLHATGRAYRCAHHEVSRINGADLQEGDVRNSEHVHQQTERKQQVERVRARMSPALLEKIRIVGETGELPDDDPRPTYRRF